MTDTPTQGLHARIAETMGALGYVPKNGHNKFHGYKYATEADVSDAIRKELSTRGVAVYTSSKLIQVREALTPKGKPTLLTDVEVSITFAHGEESFTITSVGTGDDPSDKGTYKAITGAVKYALMKTFLVPTGDDPELAEQHQEPRAANEPAPDLVPDEELARMKDRIDKLQDGERKNVGAWLRSNGIPWKGMTRVQQTAVLDIIEQAETHGEAAA